MVNTQNAGPAAPAAAAKAQPPTARRSCTFCRLLAARPVCRDPSERWRCTPSLGRTTTRKQLASPAAHQHRLDMLGLRPLAQQQDENALAGLHRPAALKGGGGAGGEGGLGVRKSAAPTPGFPRKALGNITNNAGGRGLDAENAPPGKTPAGAGLAPARRALGDITNAGAPGGLQRASGLKPLQAAQQPAAAACAPAVADAPTSRADALAEDGVERAYGRGWQALEAGRLAREDEESGRRLAALANFPGRGLPNFFPLWVRPWLCGGGCAWSRGAGRWERELDGAGQHPASRVLSRPRPPPWPCRERPPASASSRCCRRMRCRPCPPHPWPSASPALRVSAARWWAGGALNARQSSRSRTLRPSPAPNPTCAAGGALAPLDLPTADVALPDLPCPSLDDELPGCSGSDFF